MRRCSIEVHNQNELWSSECAFSVPLGEWHMGKLNRRHFLILLFNAGSPRARVYLSTGKHVTQEGI